MLQTKENQNLKDHLDELKCQLAQQGLDIINKLKDEDRIEQKKNSTHLLYHRLGRTRKNTNNNREDT